MIKPIEFYARNYKAYKEIKLKVGKFNVFIGRNSAGKSALARLAPLILKSLNVAPGNVIDYTPLNIDIGASYHDIVYGHNEYTRLELGATFDCNGKIVSFLTELTFSTELKTLVVSKFNANFNEINFQAELDLEGLEENGDVKYLVEGETQSIIFDGLIPRINESNESILFLLLENIRDYDFNISYLGPFRSELQRTYTVKTIKDLDIGDKGQNAPYIFKDIDYKSNGVLSNKIKEWMHSHFNGKYFALRSFEQSFSVICSSQFNDSNIIDEGMGFAQVFPSIINRNVRDLKKIKGMEIIEQPELHIHPAACGTVADLYLNARNSNIIFVETHSKEFVLRVRRRVAEGIDCDDVNVIYVDYDAENKTAKLSPIRINEKGGVDWWPKGIFEEDFDEVIALNMANDAK
ncbi:AAA family ATPase [Cedecea davisae]|uniref:AAA family ATPase n=1 Tax=Cedecea davisae TaxID=158484 RepID=A0ABS6DGZ2_9ENTR|nr:AAA family ATPase [Cedecea davisae]MBU4682481.1 AAA family ATPase [Cedecea davisae]MBU4688085.1 AAA family ATPase [Cedecea davisae]